MYRLMQQVVDSGFVRPEENKIYILLLAAFKNACMEIRLIRKEPLNRICGFYQ